MKVVVTIDTDNAAFGDTSIEIGQEVARILREYAEKTEQGSFGAILRDMNGNIVGGACTKR